MEPPKLFAAVPAITPPTKHGRDLRWPLGGDLRWVVGRARFAIEEVMRRYNITEYIGNLLNLAGEARRAGTGEGLSVDR